MVVRSYTENGTPSRRREQLEPTVYALTCHLSRECGRTVSQKITKEDNKKMLGGQRVGWWQHAGALPGVLGHRSLAHARRAAVWTVERMAKQFRRWWYHKTPMNRTLQAYTPRLSPACYCAKIGHTVTCKDVMQALQKEIAR